MKKRAKVHLLPTDKTDGTLWKTTSEQLIHTHVSGEYKEKYQPFNLYITTDDEIKEGDWCLFFWDGMKDGELGQVGSEPQQYLPSKGHTLNLNLRKIIATTDPKLRSDSLIEDPARPEDNLLIRKGIPQIPQSLIESYCKNPVDKVMVEYWEVCPHYDGKHRGKDCSCKIGFIYEPRITSNNEIIIHPVKDSWTVEDLPDLLNRFCKDHSLHRGLQITDCMIREWLEKQ